jgi:hypothetical protein
MKKKRKHPKEMTADEAISHVFHPDALKHLKEHLEKIPYRKRKPLKQDS